MIGFVRFVAGISYRINEYPPNPDWRGKVVTITRIIRGLGYFSFEGKEYDLFDDEAVEMTPLEQLAGAAE